MHLDISKLVNSEAKKALFTGIIFISFITALTSSINYDNSHLSKSRFTVYSPEITEDFNNFKIIHISDLHSKEFGKNQDSLINQIKTEKPDIIVYTGDLIDEKETSHKNGLKLLSRCKDIAPTYYVTGNHEWWDSNAVEIKDELRNNGIIVLENNNNFISRKSSTLQIAGVDDPDRSLRDESLKITYKQQLEYALYKTDSKNFTILLAHRPEDFNLYQELNVDLALTGHTHGGQIQLPFIGGLLAPDQGFFPKYDKGLFKEGNSYMVVNSGLGNSTLFPRLFNQPEIGIITLKHQNQEIK